MAFLKLNVVTEIDFIENNFPIKNSNQIVSISKSLTTNYFSLYKEI